MIAVLLALVAALAYGVSDFLGGLLSKSRSSWTVAWAAAVVLRERVGRLQALGLGLAVAAVVLVAIGG